MAEREKNFYELNKKLKEWMATKTTFPQLTHNFYNPMMAYIDMQEMDEYIKVTSRKRDFELFLVKGKEWFDMSLSAFYYWLDQDGDCFLNYITRPYVKKAVMDGSDTIVLYIQDSVLAMRISDLSWKVVRYVKGAEVHWQTAISGLHLHSKLAENDSYLARNVARDMWQLGIMRLTDRWMEKTVYAEQLLQGSEVSVVNAVCPCKTTCKCPFIMATQSHVIVVAVPSTHNTAKKYIEKQLEKGEKYIFLGDRKDLDDFLKGPQKFLYDGKKVYEFPLDQVSSQWCGGARVTQSQFWNSLVTSVQEGTVDITLDYKRTVPLIDARGPPVLYMPDMVTEVRAAKCYCGGACKCGKVACFSCCECPVQAVVNGKIHVVGGKDKYGALRELEKEVYRSLHSRENGLDSHDDPDMVMAFQTVRDCPGITVGELIRKALPHLRNREQELLKKLLGTERLAHHDMKGIYKFFLVNDSKWHVIRMRESYPLQRFADQVIASGGVVSYVDGVILSYDATEPIQDLLVLHLRKGLKAVT